jgi:hypothetical protein
MTATESVITAQADKTVTLRVTVNELPVVLHERHMTSAEIKAAAIAQQVPIQQSFQLILRRPGHASKVIGDNERVTIVEGETFRAIPADDNS